MSTNRDFDIRIFGHPFERIFDLPSDLPSWNIVVLGILYQQTVNRQTVVLNMQYQHTLTILIRREYVHYVLNILNVCF